MSLNRIIINHSTPLYLFVYNGSEFAGQLLDLWTYCRKVRFGFSRPGKTTDNSFIETFNGALRYECLNLHWFASLHEATDPGHLARRLQ